MRKKIQIEGGFREIWDKKRLPILDMSHKRNGDRFLTSDRFIRRPDKMIIHAS